MPRRNSRGGHNAAENLISALRCLYQRAVDDGLMEEKDNPARKVAKGRRLPSTRRAVRAACRAAGSPRRATAIGRTRRWPGRILPASPITGGDTSFPWFGEVGSPDSGDPDSPGSVRR